MDAPDLLQAHLAPSGYLKIPTVSILLETFELTGPQDHLCSFSLSCTRVSHITSVLACSCDQNLK